MEEKINHIFDEKIKLVRDVSKKNTAKMYNLKEELKLLVMKLKCNLQEQNIEELQTELKIMKAQKLSLADEINGLKHDLRFINNILGEDYEPKTKMNINDILFSPSNPDHELFKSCFKEIFHASRNIQERLQQIENS